MIEKISRKVKLGYGAGEFSSSIFFTITSFWLMNFLTDEVGLSAALAGTALLVGKFWDAGIDPFIGYFSDHTHSRWGRRRPYILFFTIPFGIAFVLMFRNPGIASQMGKFWWALLTYIFFCTVYSLTNIPYNALLPEISHDYNERTNIAGFKQGYAVIGTILGAGAAMPIMALFANKTAGFVGMSAVFGFLAALSLMISFFSVREPATFAEPKGENLGKIFKDIFTNRPFLLLLTAWFCNTTAAAVMEAMLIYYYKYIFKAENSVTAAMIILLVVTISTIPFWVWLAKRLPKRTNYIIGMSLILVAVIFFGFLGDKIGQTAALGVMAVAGFGFSSHYVMPWSMAPDTIENGYARTGVRREGVYYSVWTFMTGLAGAVAGFLIGQILSVFGYVANVAQTGSSILGIRILIGVVPAVFILIANLTLIFYPLDQKRYEALQESIREMEAGKVTVISNE